MAKSQGNCNLFQERFYLQGLCVLGSEKITHSSHHSAHKASPSRSTLIARHKEKERYMNRSQPAETQTRHHLPSHLPIPINNNHKPYALAPRALQFLVASPEEPLNIIESFSTFRYHYSYGYFLGISSPEKETTTVNTLILPLHQPFLYVNSPQDMRSSGRSDHWFAHATWNPPRWG